MYYTVYKTTNIVNDKIYIGCHKTSNLEDGYIGSGTLLKRAITKYGKESFSREILHVLDTSEEMFSKEAELVDEVFVSRKDTYNIKLGGNGGFDHLNDGSDKQQETIRKAQAAAHLVLIDKYGKDYPSILGKIGADKRTPEQAKEIGRKALSTIIERYGHGFTLGCKLSTEHKAKIGKANSVHQKGRGNSQYDTMWVYCEDTNTSKKIKNTDPIPEGWIKGRKIK